MAEIKVTDRMGKRSRRALDPLGGAAESALSRIGATQPEISGSIFPFFDVGPNAGADHVPSREIRCLHGEEAAMPSQNHNSDSSRILNGSDGVNGLNISFATGAIVVNETRKSPEEIARDIVKPLSKELKKLGYLSS